VLGWRRSGSSLILDLDTVLLPDHPQCRAPTSDEWACFRRSALTFWDVQDLHGYEELDASRPATDATGERDYGHIYEAEYTRLGEYRLLIELGGPLSFRATRVSLLVSDVQQPLERPGHLVRRLARTLHARLVGATVGATA
jgi:hypothetical protein